MKTNLKKIFKKNYLHTFLFCVLYSNAQESNIRLVFPHKFYEKAQIDEIDEELETSGAKRVITFKKRSLLKKVLDYFKKNNQKLNDYSIKGLVGKFPNKLTFIIKQLTDINNFEDFTSLFLNRLILYGPPGNGKSTIAKKIATLSGSKLIICNGPTIIGNYIGDAAIKIEETFERAEKLAKNEGRAVIIFIDEIDAIATTIRNRSNDSASEREQKAALQTLWLKLDAYKNNSKVFFIGATNHFDILDKTFLDRFGVNLIEIKNPDTEQRKEILKYYLTKFHFAIDENLLTEIVKKTDQLSIRSLEDLVSEIKILTELNPHEEVTSELIFALIEQTMKKNNKTASIIKKFIKNGIDLIQSTNQVLLFLLNLKTFTNIFK